MMFCWVRFHPDVMENPSGGLLRRADIRPPEIGFCPLYQIFSLFFSSLLAFLSSLTHTHIPTLFLFSVFFLSCHYFFLLTPSPFFLSNSLTHLDLCIQDEESQTRITGKEAVKAHIIAGKILREGCSFFLSLCKLPVISMDG